MSEITNSMADEAAGLRKEILEWEKLYRQTSAHWDKAQSEIATLRADKAVLQKQNLTLETEWQMALDRVHVLEQEIKRARLEGQAEAYELVGRRYSKLLQVATPADHIRADDARERELEIYRSESKFWHSEARVIRREMGGEGT